MNRLSPIYLWVCGLWTLFWGAFYFLGAAFAGHGGTMSRLNTFVFLVQTFGYVVYGILAISLAVLVRKGIARYRGVLLMLVLLNVVWIGAAFGLYLRYLIFADPVIKVGKEILYLEQYPYFNYSHISSPELLNVLTYVLLLAVAVVAYFSVKRAESVDA